MNRSDVLRFTRFDSGRHFLDSGGAYGRVHESPAPEDGPELAVDPAYPKSTAIVVTQLLVDVFDQDEALQGYVDSWNAEHDSSYFEATQTALESLGYTCAARDNVYNGENALDQVYVWEVWECPSRGGGDWVYPGDSAGYWPEDTDITADADLVDVAEDGLPETVVVLYLHTGCDVRGGYSPPLVGRFEGESTIPCDLCVEWCPDDAYEDHPAYEDILNEGSCGYSSNPTYHLERGLGVDWDSAEWVEDKGGWRVNCQGEPIVLLPGRPHY